MQLSLGQKLLGEGVITENELNKALERQALCGGRIGTNLAVLGFISEEELQEFLRQDPQVPESIEATGLELSFVADLILKHALFLGVFDVPEAASKVKLPRGIVDKAMDLLRNERFIEVKGAAQYSKMAYKFSLTERGRKQAQDLLNVCQYVGPAPVTYDHYCRVINGQSIKNCVINDQTIRQAFSNLVVNEQILERLGPALNSGRAIFLYGPPGNGKTTIAETVGKILPDKVYVPYSVMVSGEIILVYDPITHAALESEQNGPFDQRWVPVERPTVIVGGELTLKTLDLEFNQISKFYTAPLQMKANNGLFIVDDYGRQQVDPKHLLNRWIIPLERRVDFMTLHTGMKFEIPFDQLVIFATNIEPKQIVDEAFLRRIRYKIKIGHPHPAEYKEIFLRVCDYYQISYDQDVFDYLIENFYKRLGVELNACHPRDILEHIIDHARYSEKPPKMTKEAIAASWESYFVH